MIAPGCVSLAAPRRQDVPEAVLERIVVTPGDLSGQPYRILGPIEFPGRDAITLRGRCTPDLLRQAAVQRYGTVDAIIGYTWWQDGQQARCAGTAVVFVPQSSWADRQKGAV